MKNKLIILFILVLAAILRLIALDHYPNGLNADEAAIGYNAYSLLITGQDEHGISWPLVFRSFDDYKPPIYFYLVLPSIKFLGLTVLAVRLPSALLGIATVYLLYLIVRRLFPTNYPLAQLSALLLAISPWHLHFSRGGWEVNTATFFLALGLWAFFSGLTKPKYYFISVISFIISLYTYHSMRVVIPLLGVYLLITQFSTLKNVSYLKILLPAALIGFVLLFPLIFQTFSGSASSRFAGVSIFADQGPLLQANEFRGNHPDPSSLIPKLLHNKYIYYGLRFIHNVTKHYSDPFLFFTGDDIGRSKVPDMGQSYIWTLPFFAFGLWFLASNLTTSTGFILFWFFVGSFAAALTFQSPHALRSQNISLPFQAIIAAGIYQVYLWIKHSRIFLMTAACLLSLTTVYGLSRYLHQYYVHYPQEIPYAWQPGFDQLATYLQENSSKYQQITISTRYDQPYILTAFFLRYPPRLFQSELVFSTPDQYGFSTGLQFGKYHFKKIVYSTDSLVKNTLLVVTDEPVASTAKPIHTIYYPTGDPIFRLFATGQ